MPLRYSKKQKKIRPLRRKKVAKKSVAKNAKAIKEVKSFINKTIENKQIDYWQSLSVSTGGTATYPFLKTSQGDTDGGTTSAAARTGNKVTLMSQIFDMNIKPSEGVSPDAYNQIRIIAVESVDGSSTLALSDILTYHSYAVSGDLVFCSPYKTTAENNKRYNLVYDNVVEVSAVGGSSKATRTLRFGKRWKNGKVINFDDNLDDPTNHKMHLFMISDSSAGPHPVVDYNCRSKFKDA